MLNNSILGSLYVSWVNSRVFAVVYAIFLPFLRAFRSSCFMGTFFRDSRLEVAYAESKTAKFFEILLLIVTAIPRAVYRKFKPAFDSSAIVKLCSGSFFLRLEFMLSAFIFVMFVSPHQVWSNGYALLGSGGILLLYLCSVAIGKRKLLSVHELGFPFLLFVIACFASLMFTRDLNDSIRVLMFFISSFMLFYIISAIITDERKLFEFMTFIYGAVILTSLYAIAQRFIGVEVDMLLTDIANNHGVPGRVYSTLDNPNNYAEFLVIFVPVCVAYAMNIKNPTMRFLLCCALVFPAVAMVMTYSRSGWISLLISAVVFIYFLNRKLIPIFVILGILAVPFLPESVVTRVMSIFSGNDTSAAHRFYVWDGILLLLADNFHWLTGIGIGPETFNEVYPTYARKWATDGVYHSQMQYLEMIMEMGLIGFIAFFWLLMRNIKVGIMEFYKNSNKLNGIVAGAAATSLIGLLALFAVEYVWYYPRVLFAFFILLGLLSAICKKDFNKTLKAN